MATLYICTYHGAVAQWNISGSQLISDQPNIILKNDQESNLGNKLFFGNGNSTGNNYIHFYRGLDNNLGLKFLLQNDNRFNISNSDKTTNLEPSTAGSVTIGIGTSSAASLYVYGTVYPNLIHFPDNTTLNSANFISSIVGFNAQLSILNASISGIDSRLNTLSQSNWTPMSGGIRYESNIEVGGSGKFKSQLLLESQSEPISVMHNFRVWNVATSTCKQYNVATPLNVSSNGFPKGTSGPNGSCSANYNKTIVYSSSQISIIKNSNIGVSIGQTTATSITITPQGSIKFKDGSEIESATTGLQLAHTVGNAITITPQGSIKFKDGSEMSSANPMQWKNITNGINYTGNVGIGTFQSISEKLEINGNLRVQGKIAAKRVTVSINATFPDYVFDKNYKAYSIEETEKFIKENHHLPELKKGKKYETDGIDVTEMLIIQTKKIEELTLWIIEQNKKIKALEAIKK